MCDLSGLGSCGGLVTYRITRLLRQVSQDTPLLVLCDSSQVLGNE